MVCITGLFLLSISPFCFAFASAAFHTPKSTKWLDWTFSFPLLNGMFQPIIYIFSFERLREVFVKVICCERSKEGKRTVMVLSIFQASRALSGNFFDMHNRKGGLTPKPKSDLKEDNPENSKNPSQVTTLSEDETSSHSTDNKEGVATVKSKNNIEGINTESQVRII